MLYLLIAYLLIGSWALAAMTYVIVATFTGRAVSPLTQIVFMVAWASLLLAPWMAVNLR